MKVNSFQDLIVWKKAHFLVLEIYKLTRIFPDEERFGLISQIRRSSGSICANLAEGYIKSTKEFLRFIDIARGSLEETKYHLLLCWDLKYCTIDRFTELYALSDEIGRMLFGLRKKL